MQSIELHSSYQSVSSAYSTCTMIALPFHVVETGKPDALLQFPAYGTGVTFILTAIF